MLATREELDMLRRMGEPATLPNIMMIREAMVSCSLDGETQCGWECPACKHTTNVTQKQCCNCGRERK